MNVVCLEARPPACAEDAAGEPAADHTHHTEMEVWTRRWWAWPTRPLLRLLRLFAAIYGLAEKGAENAGNFLLPRRRSVGLLLGLGGGRWNWLPEYDGDRVGLGRARGAAAVGDDFFQECVQARHDLRMLSA